MSLLMRFVSIRIQDGRRSWIFLNRLSPSIPGSSKSRIKISGLARSSSNPKAGSWQSVMSYSCDRDRWKAAPKSSDLSIARILYMSSSASVVIFPMKEYHARGWASNHQISRNLEIFPQFETIYLKREYLIETLLSPLFSPFSEFVDI